MNRGPIVSTIRDGGTSLTDGEPATEEPVRFYVIGGPGSGKSWLADELAGLWDLPVFHLDDIAREGGGDGPERPLTDRLRAVASITAGQGWVVEGIHLGWTDDLMHSADMIIWLDYVTWRSAVRRIIGRFLRNAVGEMRRQRGWRKFLRFGDYRRQLSQLLATIPATRSYYLGPRRARRSELAITRAETERYLERYGSKVTHTRTEDDLNAVLINRPKDDQSDHTLVKSRPSK